MLFKGTWKIHVCAPLPLSSPPLPPLVLLDYVCGDMTNTGRRKNTVIYQCSWRWHHAVNTTTGTVAMFSKLTCVRLRAACFSKYGTSVTQVHGDVHVPLRWQRGMSRYLRGGHPSVWRQVHHSEEFQQKGEKIKHKRHHLFFNIISCDNGMFGGTQELLCPIPARPSPNVSKGSLLIDPLHQNRTDCLLVQQAFAPSWHARLRQLPCLFCFLVRRSTAISVIIQSWILE